MEAAPGVSPHRHGNATPQRGHCEHHLDGEAAQRGLAAGNRSQLSPGWFSGLSRCLSTAMCQLPRHLLALVDEEHREQQLAVPLHPNGMAMRTTGVAPPPRSFG